MITNGLEDIGREKGGLVMAWVVDLEWTWSCDQRRARGRGTGKDKVSGAS